MKNTVKEMRGIIVVIKDDAKFIEADNGKNYYITKLTAEVFDSLKVGDVVSFTPNLLSDKSKYDCYEAIQVKIMISVSTVDSKLKAKGLSIGTCKKTPEGEFLWLIFGDDGGTTVVRTPQGSGATIKMNEWVDKQESHKKKY